MQNPPPIYPINPEHPEPEVIEAATRVLKKGGLIILPTETVYGVGVDARLPGGEDLIFKAKARDPRKPIPLLAHDLDAVLEFGAQLPPAAERLARCFWPGALTIVLPVGAGWEGFRVPDHPVALAITRGMGGVLRVTSANLSGEPPACTAQSAWAALADHVQFVLDAGPCHWNEASTVVKVTTDSMILLRAGVIDWLDIQRIASGKSA